MMELIILLFALFLIHFIYRKSRDYIREKIASKALDAYRERLRLERQWLLNGPNSASLPVLDAFDFSYRLVGKEKLLGVQAGVTRMELKVSGHSLNSSLSVSIPIAKGVRYRVSSGSAVNQKQLRATAFGRLVVTDKAISFESSQLNERIAWSQVSDIEIQMNSLCISKRSGRPRLYHIDGLEPRFVVITELMLNRIG